MKNSNIKKKQLLENLLKEKITLETDVMDFFIIDGWDYWLHPNWYDSDDKIRNIIKKSIIDKKKKLSTSDKIKETRFYKNCFCEIGYGKKFKTLFELKKILENERTFYRGINYKCFEYFNKRLNEYGIESFKVCKKHLYFKRTKIK